MLIIRNKYFLIVSLLVLVFGAGLLIKNRADSASEAAGHEAAAKVDTFVNGSQVLASEDSSQCYSSNLIKSLLKWRDCTSTQTVYIGMEGETSATMQQLYETATSNGWLVWDNGRVNDFGFDQAGYMGAIIDDASRDGEARLSNLTVRVIEQEELDLPSNQLNESLIQKLKAVDETIVRIHVATNYEG